MNQKNLERAVIIGIAFNIILTILKLVFGYSGSSRGLITDGYNSLSDVVVSILVYFVLRISNKKPDEHHPYGHQKFEGIAFFALGMGFLLVSIVLFVTTSGTLINFIKNGQLGETPSLTTFYIALIALGIKLFLALFYKKLYKKSKHPTLKAESNNHAIDMIATTFTIIGIGLSQLGFVIFDYIAAIIIVCLILRLAIMTLKEAISYLVDEAPEKQLIDQIYHYIEISKGVLSVDDLKVRRHMTNLYVDVEIGVNERLSLKEAHQIAEYVHHRVEKEFPKVIHCMVHVNPVVQI
ncbi:MAG: cation diffusion facilitator family transporter [Acholeplasmataceae bacterium]